METLTKIKWVVDPTHSEVNFKVKHLVISTVSGSFQKFDGIVETNGDNFEDARVEFTIDPSSISTNQSQRDDHLRAADFFDVATYPTITFRSTVFEKAGEDQFKLTGDLTIRDVTKAVTLDVEYGGSATDFYGNLKAGFEVKGKISRKEYGLTWGAVTEAGSVVVGDDINWI
ncbi:MAG TPA: YceI family protein [Sphingobacteriaceae bacterium]|nr:YceI family protein [Sphingobacteriaceae bacterium]